MSRTDAGPQRVYREGTEPDPRFTFANERTFLARIRTSLTLIAAGVALEHSSVASAKVHVTDHGRTTSGLMIKCSRHGRARHPIGGYRTRVCPKPGPVTLIRLRDAGGFNEAAGLHWSDSSTDWRALTFALQPSYYGRRDGVKEQALCL
jgi:hypothetical protein